MFHFFIALFICVGAQASERILLFKSDITVHTDGHLDITETIKVRSAGDQIRRGIMRDFPTHYQDQWGNDVVVGFQLLDVQRDGKSESFQLSSFKNGKRIIIGNSKFFLAPGNYTYTIHYTTNRQIGFFKSIDELYFNITGNGWTFPIDKAIAVIHLPGSIPKEKIIFEAYAGYHGSKGRNYTAAILDNNSIVFETTRPLYVYQGLTIAVAWPKGYVNQPSWWQLFVWFVHDNLLTLLLLIALIAMSIYFVSAYLAVRAANSAGTIIPLFYPPQGMSPAAARYVDKMKFDEIAFASNIVDMAVHGLITMEQKQKVWSSLYTLYAKGEPVSDSAYASLYKKLFGSFKSISTTKDDAARMKEAYDHAYLQLVTDYPDSFFLEWHKVLIGGSIFILSLLLYPILAVEISSLNATLYGLLFLIPLVSAYYLYRYSKQGLKLKNEIEGFKLFLKTTEEDRIKIIGTPPTKTPELYEKYLPYAIALGVEEQWSQQFAPLFAQMQQEGSAYVPLWYSGRRFRSFSSSSFGSSIGRSISSNISSSGISPGSFSGSGGRGFSGGGGGGGGGRGW